MTGHYIGAAESDSNYWELKCEQLGFTRIEGNHSGANLGGILVRVIDRYGIRRKASVYSIVLSLSGILHSPDWLVYCR